MRKVILSLFLIVIVIAAASPWISGYYFKQQYEKLIQVVNSSGHFRIEELAYEEGYLTSISKLKVIPLKPDGQVINVSFTLTNEIHHGPITFDYIEESYSLGYGSIKSESHLFQSDIQLPPGMKFDNLTLTVHALLKLDKEWLVEYHIPKWSGAMQKPGTMLANINWAGVTGNYNFKITDNQINAYQAGMKLGGFNIVVNDSTAANGQNRTFQFESTALEVNSEGKQAQPDIWIGSGMATLESISVQTPTGNVLASGLQINTSSDLNNGMVNASFKVDLHDLTIPHPVFSKISPISYALNVNGISPQGLAEVRKIMQSQASNEQRMENYFKALPHIVSPAFAILSNLTVGTAFGNFVADAKFSFNSVPVSVPEMAAKANLVINLTVAVPLVDKLIDVAYGTSTAPAALATSPMATTPSAVATMQATSQSEGQLMKQRIATLVQQDYVKQDKNNYTTQITYSAGMFKVNGKILSQDLMR